LKEKAKRKTNAEITEDAEFAEKRKTREKRGMGALDRRSPPFPPEAGEGRGTLKFKCGMTLEGKTNKRARGYFAPAPAGPGP